LDKCFVLGELKAGVIYRRIGAHSRADVVPSTEQLVIIRHRVGASRRPMTGPAMIQYFVTAVVRRRGSGVLDIPFSPGMTKR
jgi:hypothetical protein